jgi:uncharacterized membrane protein YcaP (DUF421 family)
MTMDLYRIALRALFAFVFLQVLMRFSGKRFVAQATGFDFVLALILGDMIDDLIWAEVPASQFVVATGVLAVIHLLTAAGSFASEKVALVVGGASRMVMRDGSALRPAMRKERTNESDLKSLLRSEGLQRARWREVKSAWIEQSGRLALLKKDWARTLQRKDAERLRAELG